MKAASKGTLFLELPDGMTDEALSTLVSEQSLGFVTLPIGEPEQFEVHYEDGRTMALGSVPPDVDWSQVRTLYFHNAILAREETNRNKDCLLAEEIENLAKSIGGMPIDDEHELESVCGVFTEARAVKGATGLLACSVDGLVWPQRFPEIARGLVAGERQLSMEVWIAAATCGMCSETFNHKDDYCAHLEHREAQRTLHGVQGFGGALTVKPAGTETTFDHNSMMVVASHHLEDEDPPLSVEGAKKMKLEERIAQLEADLATATTKVAALETELATATASLTTANADLQTASTELETAKEATDALRWSIREQKLTEAGYAAEELETNKGELAALSDVQFNILVAAMDHSGDGGDGANKKKALGTVNLGGGETGGDDALEIIWSKDVD